MDDPPPFSSSHSPVRLQAELSPDEGGEISHVPEHLPQELGCLIAAVSGHVTSLPSAFISAIYVGPQSVYSVSLTASDTLVSLLSLEPGRLFQQEALALVVLATWIIYHSALGRLLQDALPDSSSHSSPHFPPLPLLLLGLITLQIWLEGCDFPTHRIEGRNLGFNPNFCHM